MKIKVFIVKTIDGNVMKTPGSICLYAGLNECYIFANHEWLYGKFKDADRERYGTSVEDRFATIVNHELYHASTYSYTFLLSENIATALMAAWLLAFATFTVALSFFCITSFFLSLVGEMVFIEISLVIKRNYIKNELGAYGAEKTTGNEKTRGINKEMFDRVLAADKMRFMRHFKFLHKKRRQRGV